MYLSKNQGGTIQKTVLSDILLDELNVLFEELCAVPTANQVGLVTCYDYWNAEVSLEHDLWKRNLLLQIVDEAFTLGILEIRHRNLFLDPPLLLLILLFVWLFLLYCLPILPLFLRIAIEILCLSVLQHISLFDGHILHETLLNDLSEQACPLGKRLHDLPRLIEIQYDQGGCVL